MDFIYGIRPVLEALEAGKDLEKVFVQKGLQGPLFRDLFRQIRVRDIPFQFVPVQRLNRITGKNHQGVIAWVSLIEYQKIENLLPGLYEQGIVPFLVVLDRITDVRNAGAIIRTADAAGCHAIVIPVKNGAALNADAIKTSAGAISHLPICRENDLAETLRFLKSSGLQLLAATEEGENLYDHILPSGPVVLILGSEETGVHPSLLEIADMKVSIPMIGHVSSLNVSVAAGILMYEIVRQRNMVI